MGLFFLCARQSCASDSVLQTGFSAVCEGTPTAAARAAGRRPIYMAEPVRRACGVRPRAWRCLARAISRSAPGASHWHAGRWPVAGRQGLRMPVSARGHDLMVGLPSAAASVRVGSLRAAALRHWRTRVTEKSHPCVRQGGFCNRFRVTGAGRGRSRPRPAGTAIRSAAPYWVYMLNLAFSGDASRCRRGPVRQVPTACCGARVPPDATRNCLQLPIEKC